MDFSYTLENINIAAQQFLHAIQNKKVIALHGEMGAGKTTFVQAVCKLLNVNCNICSPTFSIINAYSTTDNETVYHIDLYRLKSETEAINAGVEDCLYSGNLCFVEWPEITPNLFPEDTVHCFLASPNPSPENIGASGGELSKRRLIIEL